MVAANTERIWTSEDRFELPDDRRFEVINGMIVEMPSPDEAHARSVLNLIALFLPIVREIGARIYTSPFDVFFPGANPVQPDILIVLPDRLHIIKQRGVEGAPDLVVEVVSPSRSTIDRRTKRALYARAGIKEYWLVYPRTKTIEVLTLVDATYQLHCLATGEELVSSLLLPDLAFPASATFA